MQHTVDDISFLQQSVANLESVGMSSHNGSRSYRASGAQRKTSRTYERLREPEARLRDEFCEKMIDKLSEVRHLVSNIVMEEDDDE